jgi:CheY-like chemotaxis protein
MLTVNRAPVRILLVNPNNDFGEVYQCLFEMFGCVVEFAKTGNDALLVSETFRPHAIYMSLKLGDMTGMELAMTLRKFEIKPRAVLVALTGYPQAVSVAKGLAAVFDHYLPVPAGLPELFLPLAKIPNLVANDAVSIVLQHAQPTPESQAYTAFRNVIVGR